MNIIAFHGSPRKNGNTELLLNRAIAGTGQNVRIFTLNAMDIKPCQNCGGCDKTGVCIINDAYVEIYQAIRAADRIIMASPIFFMNVSAQTKGMIDRCQCFWCEKYLLQRDVPSGVFGRKGLALLVGGMENDRGIKCAKSCVTAFMRTVSIPEHETLMYTHVDAKGEIEKHESALEDAFRAGRDLAT